jgi:hypothetical protein
MNTEPRDPKKKGTPSPSDKKQDPPQDNEMNRDKDRQENSDVQAENERTDIVVNQQEQDQVTNQSAASHPDHATTDRERSFYKNDLPENEEGTDVDERSSSIQP